MHLLTTAPIKHLFLLGFAVYCMRSKEPWNKPNFIITLILNLTLNLTLTLILSSKIVVIPCSLHYIVAVETGEPCVGGSSGNLLTITDRE